MSDNFVSNSNANSLISKIAQRLNDLPNRFVSKTGDTMTGALKIQRSDSNMQLQCIRPNSGTSTVPSDIYIGNPTPDGTAGCTHGRIVMYSAGAYNAVLKTDNLTQNQEAKLPNKSGTLALTSDIKIKEGYMNITCNTAVSDKAPFTYMGINGTTNKKILAVCPTSDGLETWLFNCYVNRADEGSSSKISKIVLYANGSGTFQVRYLYVDI